MNHPTAFSWRQATTTQRRTLLAAALGWMLDAFDVMLYSLVVATLMQQMELRAATAGLLNSLTLVASAVGSFGAGLLADRYGRRRMLSACILVYSLATFACGFARTVRELAVLRFAVGLGMGGEWNTGATLVAETWPASWRGRALGIVQSSWAIGYALAAMTAGVVLARASWRAVFFVGVLPALLALWVQARVPEPELWQAHRHEQASLHGRPVAGSAWRSIWTRLLVLLGMNTCGMFAWWGLFTWIPAYLQLPQLQGGRGLNLSGSTAFLLVLNLAGMLPGYLLFGVLADRFGRRKTLVGYLVVAAALVPLFASARQPGVVLASATLVAFFGTGFFTGSGIVGSELFPTAIRATALGLSYNLARGLSAAAPFVIGRLSLRYGLSGAFWLCGLAFALAAVLAALLPETRGTDLRRVPTGA